MRRLIGRIGWAGMTHCWLLHDRADGAGRHRDRESGGSDHDQRVLHHQRGIAQFRRNVTAGTTLVASNVDANTTVSVTCTSGSPYSIGMDNGANVSGSQRRMKSGSNFLNYNLYIDPAHTNPWTTTGSPPGCTPAGSCFLGTGNGSAQSVNIYGRVPSIGTAPPTGTYTDTVTMTITY